MAMTPTTDLSASRIPVANRQAGFSFAAALGTLAFVSVASYLAYSSYYMIIKGGGFTTGGLNFDAHLRRSSIDPADLFHAHVGAMDICARALLAVEQIFTDGQFPELVKARYGGWSSAFGQDIMAGRAGLEVLSRHVLERNQDAQPISGRQEYLENLLNRFLVE